MRCRRNSFLDYSLSEHIGYDDWATYTVHKEYYENRLATLSSFTVAISGDIEGTTVTGSVLANKVSSYLTDELTLHVVLTESNIEENWQGLSELDFVERKMFPDGNGTTVNFSTTSVSVDFTFEMDPSWNQENCKLVFFLQDNTTKEIVQGDQIDLMDLPLQTGIAKNPVKSEVEIFPNPFTEAITISADGVNEVIITDITGRIVFSSEQILQTINTSDWAQGMYFVTTIIGEERNTFKVLKK